MLGEYYNGPRGVLALRSEVENERVKLRVTLNNENELERLCYLVSATQNVYDIREEIHVLALLRKILAAGVKSKNIKSVYDIRATYLYLTMSGGAYAELPK